MRKYLWFSIINWLVCEGFFHLSKRYCSLQCTPCSNNENISDAYEKSLEYFKNNSNVTKIDVKRN